MYKVCTNCPTVQEQCIFIRFDTIINAQLLQVQEKVFVGVVASQVYVRTSSGNLYLSDVGQFILVLHRDQDQIRPQMRS